MNFDVVESLSRYINNTAEPMRWCPIVVLVISWFELKYLMFQSPTKQELEGQLSQSRWQEIYYAARLREILLCVLVIALAWLLFFMFITCQRLKSAVAVSHPLE